MAQTVTPLPSIGDVIPGQDVVGRQLRISGHPESDRLVLSIWQSGHCLATVRLARADVPEVTRALVAGLVPLPGLSPVSPDGEPATVHQLPLPATGMVSEIADRISGATTRLFTGLVRVSRRFSPRD